MARRRDGFSLVEAAVAVAVAAILAGMMAPLGARVLQQRRAAATREALRRAFEALFGNRDRRVPNLRADFGFDPGDGSPDLAFLVTRPAAWAGLLPFGSNGTLYPWGWNGPYWLGDTRNGAPVDAWGGPIELVRTGLGVQVRSRGPRRGEQQTEDDLVYPPEPVPLAAFDAHLLVVVSLDRPGGAGAVQVQYGRDGRQSGRIGKQTSLLFEVPAGGLQLVFQPDQGDNFPRRIIPMDLLPGETREVRVQL